MSGADLRRTPRSALRIRVISWALLGVLAALYYVVLGLDITPQLRLVIHELIYCSPIVVTVWLGMRAREVSEGVERNFWGFLASANAVLFLAELLLIWWVFVLNPAGPPRVSWPFHIIHVVAAVSFIGLLLSMTWLPQASTIMRVRWALDAVSLMLIASVVLMFGYVEPAMSPAGAPVAHILLGTGYALFGLVMISGTFANIVGLKVDRWRSWDKLIALSLTVYAIAVFLWPTWYDTAATTSRNYQRGLLDIVQFCGHWLLMMATVYRVTEIDFRPLRPLPPRVRSHAQLGTIVVPAISIVSIPVLAWAAYSSIGQKEWFAVYVTVATLLTLIVMMRSVVVALENGALFHRSVTDPLTGLYNHRFFHDRLGVEIGLSTRYGEPLSVIALDLDQFGHYNEKHGHLSGDRLLIQIARLLNSTCARSCVVARLGGDEFAIMLPRTDADEAVVLANRILDVIGIESTDEPGSVAASAGVATFPYDATEAERLLRLADGALFDAKESGRGCVVRYHAERVPDLNARERIVRLERQNRIAAVRALAAAVDARDTSTQDHSRNVADLSRGLAEVLGLDTETVKRVETAGYLHDVGKIGVPDHLLNKIDDLAPHELEKVREHAVLGQQILASASLDELTPLVRSHHEWWNGSGYPDGLAAEEIPIESRVIAVCDAYDSMTSRRLYRDPTTPGLALDEIAARAGTQFDPRVASTFVEMMRQGMSAKSRPKPMDR